MCGATMGHCWKVLPWSEPRGRCATAAAAQCLLKQGSSSADSLILVSRQRQLSGALSISDRRNLGVQKLRAGPGSMACKEEGM